MIGAQAARQHAAEFKGGADFHLPEVGAWKIPRAQPDDELITQDLSLIRNTMWNHVGLVRTGKRLDRATNVPRELKNKDDSY